MKFKTVREKKMIKLIKNHPAIQYKDYLVIADLHLGIEREYWEKGYEMPSQKEELLKRIKKIKGKTEKLIILGDIKHNIPLITYREEKEIPEFINELKKIFNEVIIIKGNHDGNLERLTPCMKEYIIDDVAFIHGHTVSKQALQAKKIIAGHMHPVFTYKNHLGINQSMKCFIITPKIIIIMPAFTELSAGYNELAKPLKKYIQNEEVLLLNHTKIK